MHAMTSEAFPLNTGGKLVAASGESWTDLIRGAQFPCCAACGS